MIYCRKKLGDNNLPRLFWDENDCNGNIINYFSSATVFPTMAAVLYSTIGLQLSWPNNWCTVTCHCGWQAAKNSQSAIAGRLIQLTDALK